MTQTSVTELKAHLSAVLRRVKRGESVVISERGHAIATIVPTAARDHDQDAWVARLVKEGRLIPPRDPRPLDLDALDRKRPVARGSVVELLIQERESGR